MNAKTATAMVPQQKHARNAAGKVTLAMRKEKTSHAKPATELEKSKSTVKPVMPAERSNAKPAKGKDN